MNVASERDPFNNNSFGTLVDSGYKLISLPVLDVNDFNERIIRGYEEGYGEKDLPADLSVARSLVPAGTATLRDFSNISPEIPEYLEENCTGCMDCVTECPDTAILGKVLGEDEWEEKLQAIPAEDREMYRKQWSKTKKYYDGPKKKGLAGGMFQIIIDPSKCKGCAECVTVCDDDALKMIQKTDQIMTTARKSHRYFKSIGPSNSKYVNDNLLIDMMLKEQTHIYVGGAGSCAGCGEGTALRMLCAATGSKFGHDWGLVAATGCNTVYTSTYPYNPYLVPWTNSLFENAPAYAIGVRMRWDQMGWQHKPLWCIGGDGAMYDIGFQALSRMLASGKNIKVFVLDTQVYSNTGGQASTASFTGQNTKMSVHGKTIDGKQERRKEIAQIAMMHPRTFVAQTTCAHANHFYKSVLGAMEFDGPAVVSCYTTCQPEHGVADNMAGEQARLAVDSRAFPLLIFDPRAGDTIKKRLSLQGKAIPT
jgi:pyruvate/2-oxoacid:ferredoxin oxidoreductase beta subunit/NAD-dependent dihydropyrimidine dehydrogenase PreA subunit